ncbi:ISL3 family transposase [Kribbella sp. CA-294648]|uniref:ISL3 family transposase n=1 Tax=Kribbella sp. CA-294648 TaxID=3239948 RepID=UPI003D8A40D1
MRVTTVFNRVLGLDDTSVAGVVFAGGEAVVTVRRLAKVHRCPCGCRVPGRYDRSVRRWRHVDACGLKVWLEAEVARIWCPDCERVRTEDVPWARPGARHSRAFEDTVAWLAARMDKTSLAQLMRCSWEAVDRIVGRVVVERLDDSRLNNLVRIGVDEISYLRGHRYLTVVVDHDSGRVVWVGKGHGVETIAAFYRELGFLRRKKLRAVTMDASGTYISVTRAMAPQAVICIDPFHVIKWANEALDSAFRNSAIPTLRAEMKQARSNAAWRKARFALRAGREKLRTEHLKILKVIRAERTELHKVYLLKEELRDLFQIIDPSQASSYLHSWVQRATGSGSAAFRTLAHKIIRHADGIIAAVELGLSNSRSEGVNTKIRVIQRRGYGHPKAQSLATMIYLCCSGIQLSLPTQR